MALFTDIDTDFPTRRPTRRWIGWSLIAFAVLVILGVGAIPSPYVVQQPGPVFDTLGSVEIDGEQVALIEIDSAETYETEGSLSMLTVRIQGNRERTLSWFDVVRAWFDPSQAVVPVDSVYPVGTTSEQSSEQSRIEMEVSQQEAIAAALGSLDYEFTSTLTIEGTDPEGVSEGQLLAGDIIVSVNDKALADVSELRQAIAANGTETAASVVIEREGIQRQFSIVPKLSDSDEAVPVLGILVSSEYDFPFEVSIQLENVGGPSAGQMFALGIIDKLTPGALTGGEDIAGTGTITASGEIGPIGGIRQKMFGAVRSGAEYFLAPADNCDEVVGHVPVGLEVFAVETLADSLAALDAISDASTAGLATCEIG